MTDTMSGICIEISHEISIANIHLQRISGLLKFKAEMLKGEELETTNNVINALEGYQEILSKVSRSITKIARIDV